VAANAFLPVKSANHEMAFRIHHFHCFSMFRTKRLTSSADFQRQYFRGIAGLVENKRLHFVDE